MEIKKPTAHFATNCCELCADEHCHSDSPSAVHALDAVSCGGGVFLVGDDVFVQELSKPGVRHREGGYGTVAAVNEGE